MRGSSRSARRTAADQPPASLEAREQDDRYPELREYARFGVGRALNALVRPREAVPLLKQAVAWCKPYRPDTRVARGGTGEGTTPHKSHVSHTSHRMVKPDRLAMRGRNGRGWDRTSDLPRVKRERMATGGD